MFLGLVSFLHHYFQTMHFYFFLNLRLFCCKKVGDVTIVSSSSFPIQIFLGVGNRLSKASLNLLLKGFSETCQSENPICGPWLVKGSVCKSPSSVL